MHSSMCTVIVAYKYFGEIVVVKRFFVCIKIMCILKRLCLSFVCLLRWLSWVRSGHYYGGPDTRFLYNILPDNYNKGAETTQDIHAAQLHIERKPWEQERKRWWQRQTETRNVYRSTDLYTSCPTNALFSQTHFRIGGSIAQFGLNVLFGCTRYIYCRVTVCNLSWIYLLSSNCM